MSGGLSTLKDRLAAPFLPIVRVGRAIWMCVSQETLPQMAASLAYRTIFSLIPILFLSLLILKHFSDPAALKGQLNRLLDFIGLTQITDSEAATSTASTAADAAHAAGHGFWDTFAEGFWPTTHAHHGFDIQHWIDGTIDKLYERDFTNVGILAAATFIYGAISLIIGVEQSFNAVYGAKSGRSLVRRVIQYWFLVSLGPLFVFGSFLVQDQFNAIAHTVAEGSGAVLGSAFQGFMLGLSGYLITVLITGMLLFMVYLTLPNAKVRPGPAAIGALAAGLALELAKLGFSQYVKHASYKTLYASVATVPLFMLWIYLTWVIVLAGLRLSFLIQHKRTGVLLDVWRSVVNTSRGGAARGGAAWLDPMLAVSVAAAIARRFDLGVAPTSEDLAQDLRLMPTDIHRLLDELDGARVIRRVAGVGATQADAWALARPAENIPLAELIRVGHEVLGPVHTAAGVATGKGLAPLAKVNGTLRQAQIDAAGSLSLADVLGPRAGREGRASAAGAPAAAAT